jgi:hypothetical protein
MFFLGVVVVYSSSTGVFLWGFPCLECKHIFMTIHVFMYCCLYVGGEGVCFCTLPCIDVVCVYWLVGMLLRFFPFSILET